MDHSIATAARVNFVHGANSGNLAAGWQLWTVQSFSSNHLILGPNLRIIKFQVTIRCGAAISRPRKWASRVLLALIGRSRPERQAVVHKMND